MASSQLAPFSRIPLANSTEPIPIIGFGVYRIDGVDCTTACQLALTHGYRLIDSAQLYNNEAAVGDAIRASAVPRSHIFVTTKIRYPRVGKGKTYLRAEESVRKIAGVGKKDALDAKTAYVDLYLVHTPYGVKPHEIKEMWLVLEQLKARGYAKAIGVSNFKPEHLEAMKEYATVWPPAVNQLQLNPWNQQRKTVEYCHEHGIIVEAHTPLAQGEKMQEPLLATIATKYGKSAAQILIRYSLQKGWVPLPKSEKEARIKENIDVFDFVIRTEDMTALDNLDQNMDQKY